MITDAAAAESLDFTVTAIADEIVTFATDELLDEATFEETDEEEDVHDTMLH